MKEAMKEAMEENGTRIGLASESSEIFRRVPRADTARQRSDDMRHCSREQIEDPTVKFPGCVQRLALFQTNTRTSTRQVLLSSLSRLTHGSFLVLRSAFHEYRYASPSLPPKAVSLFLTFTTHSRLTSPSLWSTCSAG